MIYQKGQARLSIFDKKNQVIIQKIGLRMQLE